MQIEPLVPTETILFLNACISHI